MIVDILVALIVVGALLAILQLVPIDARIKQAGYILILALLAVWAIRVLLGGQPLRLP